jgi:Secretion system C-terminal sorting domain
MVKKICVVCVLFVNHIFGQTFGPNSPSNTTNNAAIGANPWLNTNNIVSSDNTYASVSIKGATNYLRATNFGFSLSNTLTVDGIQVEIEKKTNVPSNVAFNSSGAWQTGLSRAAPSAGLNRCLVFVAVMENGAGVTRDITSLTYGGQAMTELIQDQIGTVGGFSAKIEIWYLLNAGISAASSTAFAPTFAAGGLTENIESYATAVFNNVDQTSPASNIQTTGLNGTTNPFQLGTALTNLDGAIDLTVSVCGNNTTPSSSIGATDTYTINNGFIEGVDIYDANPSFSTSGMSFQTATKVKSTAGTEQPSVTFAGTPNRQLIVAISLQRARETDSEVRIIKTGSIIGNNYALTNSPWPTADTYVAYGGNTDLWGTTWTFSNINNPNFGAAISANILNGIVQVDHIRITVYASSPLPIELLKFEGICQTSGIDFKWITATEKNNAYFEIEKSRDGLLFESVARIIGAGNSNDLKAYNYTLQIKNDSIFYYRLKQVDFNGDFSYSELISINCNADNTFKVYPNPSSDGIFHFISNQSINKNEIAIFNEELKLLKTETLSNESNEVNLSSFADGSYYLLFTKSGKRTIKLLQKISRLSKQ